MSETIQAESQTGKEAGCKRDSFIDDGKRMIQETLDRLGEQLEHGLSGEMKNYLKIMAKFPRYSVGNQLLIFAQMPQASQVAGYRAWNQFHRYIKKGEKGIRIFAPCASRKPKKDFESDCSEEELKEESELVTYFRVAHVFDLSQTSGEDLPQTSKAQGDAEKLIPILESLIRDRGIALEYGETGSALGLSYKNAIRIKPGMDPAETFSTMVHEATHVMLHFEGDSPAADRKTQELEADAAACVVCERFGMQAITASADYIQTWDGNKKALMQQLERIRQCAAAIIQGMEQRMEVDSLESATNSPGYGIQATSVN
ncbi:MAG: ArdC family protein [Candidatus Omnitrophota bacterium]